METNNIPFEIGLSLTGSVSAGAYTAGVIDFLLEALEEWEKAKAANFASYGNDHSRWTVPWHSVTIGGFSGASGGGVTSGMVLNCIGGTIQPVREPIKGVAPANDFYNAWVNDMGLEQLTATDDLGNNAAFKSICDGNAIPSLAGNILQPERFANNLKRNYINPRLKSIITLTNLRGIPYYLKTPGIGATQLVYYRNADYVRLALASDNQDAGPDYMTIPYDKSAVGFQPAYALLRQACLATCAFPAAFPAQPVTQDTSSYFRRDNNKYLALKPGEPYEFLCSDGGICNDAPFELLHQALLDPGEDHNPRDAAFVKRAMIIVAPLDTDTDVAAYNIQQDGLPTILKGVVGAIRNEAEFSDEEISLALDEQIYSRFIIAPVRYDTSGTVVLSPAIAGQTLSYFGAFLSRDFREHDYFLARRNTQLFLRKHFALPLTEAIRNPIFAPLDLANNHEKFSDWLFVEDGVTYFCILPLTGSAAAELYEPAWPTDKYDDTAVQTAIGSRIKAIFNHVLNATDENFFIRIFFPLIKTVGSRLALKYIMKTIGSGLAKAKLISNENSNL